MLIPAAVVNDGVQMRPYLVQELQAPDLRPLYTASPQELRRAIPSEVAAALQDMMVGVVAEGTGRNAQIAGAVVGGKTGTAETGDQPEHGWFVGFAIVDGTPVTAVAVMLENAGNGGPPRRPGSLERSCGRSLKTREAADARSGGAARGPLPVG